MIHERDIRDRLASFVVGDIPQVKFERWIASISRGVFSEGSKEALALFSQIDLLISERDSGYLSDVQVRNHMLLLLNDVRQSLVFDGISFVAHGRNVVDVTIEAFGTSSDVIQEPAPTAERSVALTNWPIALRLTLPA